MRTYKSAGASFPLSVTVISPGSLCVITLPGDGCAAIVLAAGAKADGQTVEDAATVSQVALRFDSLRSEALPHSASKDLILKVAEERWT